MDLPSQPDSPMSTDLTPEAIVRLAEDIAVEAHAGQVDKADRPYIEHPRRVAARLSDPLEKAAAFLHDVVEDHPDEWPLTRLAAMGIPPEVVEAVDCLTKRKGIGETREQYFERVASNRIATAVKFADMDDNSDEGRLAHLPAERAQYFRDKYETGRAMLRAAVVGRAARDSLDPTARPQ